MPTPDWSVLFDSWNPIARALIGIVVAVVICMFVAGKIKSAWVEWVSPVVSFCRRVNKSTDRIEVIWNECWPIGKPSIIDRMGRMESQMGRFGAICFSISEVSDKPIIEIKRDGVLEYANAAALAILGICTRDAVGLGWMDSVSPLHREKLMNQLTLAEKRGASVRAHIVLQTPQQIQGHDGDSVLLSFRPYPDSDGEIDGFIGHIEPAENHPLPVPV